MQLLCGSVCALFLGCALAEPHSFIRKHQATVDAAGLLVDASPRKLDTSFIHQFLILTNQHRVDLGNQLLQNLSEHLPSSMNVEKIMGLDAEDFATEADLEDQSLFGMTKQDKEDWKQLAQNSLSGHADPSLACSLGHKQMWKKSCHAAEGHWTVILEDDALLSPEFSWAELQRTLQQAKVQSSDLVFLDDKHCQMYSEGLLKGAGVKVFSGASSAAYAITCKSARALLEAPFKLHTDRLLNKVAKDSKVAAFCPKTPLFSIMYKHTSQIGDTLLQKSQRSNLDRLRLHSE